jgi:hypothetical protein
MLWASKLDLHDKDENEQAWKCKSITWTRHLFSELDHRTTHNQHPQISKAWNGIEKDDNTMDLNNTLLSYQTISKRPPGQTM